MSEDDIYYFQDPGELERYEKDLAKRLKGGEKLWDDGRRK